MTSRCPACSGDNLLEITWALITTPLRQLYVGADGRLHGSLRGPWQSPIIEPDPAVLPTTRTWACMDCGAELSLLELLLTDKQGAERLIEMTLCDVERLSAGIRTHAKYRDEAATLEALVRNVVSTTAATYAHVNEDWDDSARPF